MNIVFCKRNLSVGKYMKIIQAFAERNHYQIEIQAFEDVGQMLFAIEDLEYSIDLLFSDVEFSGITGFDVVKQLRKNGFRGEVIFLTAVEDKWDKAFDVHAFHYVLEDNCSKERFENILTEAIATVEKKQQETIVFSCAGERVIVPLRDIQYFTVNDRWIKVYYGGNESFEFFSRIGKIEHLLTGKGFVRIHRGCIVSVRYIVSVKYNQVILQNGTILSIARGKYPMVRELLERYEGGEIRL